MDLPEPPVRTLSPQAREERRWQFVVTLNGLLFAYAILHKVLIPGVKGISQVGQVGWLGGIDWWWPFHGFLAYALARRSRAWVKRLCALGLAFSLFRLVTPFLSLMSGSHAVTWVFVSILMTEGFTTMLCLGLLLNPTFGSVRRPWLTLGSFFLIGLGLGYGSLLISGFQATKPHEIVAHHDAPLVKAERAKKADPVKAVACGAQKLVLDSQTIKEAKAVNEVRIADCGFQPSLVRTQRDLVVRNQTRGFLNLRIYASPAEAQVPTWEFIRNVAMLSGKQTRISQELIESHGLIRVYSDTRSDAGILVILGGQLSPTLSRPLKIERPQ